MVGVETLRTFQGVRDELFRMEEGARLLGAVRHLFPAEEGSLPAFNLLVRGVARLAEAPDAATAAAVVLATRLKLLALLGYAPEIRATAPFVERTIRRTASPHHWGEWCARRVPWMAPRPAS